MGQAEHRAGQAPSVSGTRPVLYRELISQAVRFGMLTVVSATITLGLPILLHEAWGVGPPTAAAIAFTLAFVANFASLRRLVFSSSHGAGRDLLIYATSSLFFRSAEYLAFLLLYAIRIQYVVALTGVLAVSATAKFFWYRRTLHGHG